MISSQDKNNTCLNNGRVSKVPKQKPKTPKKATELLVEDKTSLLIQRALEDLKPVEEPSEPEFDDNRVRFVNR